MNMDGDDAQIVDSVLREYTSQLQQPQMQQHSLGGFDPSPLTMQQSYDMNINSTPVSLQPPVHIPQQQQQQHQQKTVEVSYKEQSKTSDLWKTVRLPVLVFLVCFIVFNPYLYHYLLKLAPSVFAATSASRMQVRIVILSLLASLLFTLVTRWV
jgi:hypothetical protein